MSQTTLPPRSAIAKEHTWNAESVYATHADWEKAAQQVVNLLPGIQEYEGHLHESASTLADFLDDADTVIRQIRTVSFYANMSNAVDTDDQQAAAMTSRAGSIFGQVAAALAFMRPEMLAIGRETLDAWIAAEPRLSAYAHYVDDLFRQEKFVRSGEVEEILGMISDPLGTIGAAYGMLSDSDLKFAPAQDSSGAEYEVAQSTIDTLLEHPDRAVRRSAWNNYRDGYNAFKKTFAAVYIGSVKSDVFLARARRYPSSLEASLYNSNVPPEVFRALIDTFKKNIPTWHRYWAVKRRAHGYDTLHTYDIWAPIRQDQPVVPYTQAVQWICEGMQPLGDKYVETVRRGCLQERWVDVYPNQGKMQGAFSYGSYDTAPYIMMSYDDSLGAMSTLAHELGHSMHSELSRKHQAAINADYSMFVAEVASNFNQAMTRAHLMKANPDPAFQIALIQEAMSNFHRYFFIMPTLARFELEVHERVEAGKGVTAQDMNALMADLYAEGYGDEMTLDRERDGVTWATFSHLYAAYYVFQYATGISAAHALSEKVLAGEPGAAARYVEFLSMGGSVYPLDALKHAGVDMTTPEAVETTFAVLARYVDKLDELTRSQQQ